MRRSFTLIIALLGLTGLVSSAAAGIVSVSAAISLKDALTEIADQYQKQGGDQIDLQFGASGQLAAQIRQGAPIDLFISAARKQIDELAADQSIDPKSIQIVAGNTLVLIVPAKSSTIPSTFLDVTDPRYKKIAIGDPKTVPAGEYAVQVFQALNIHDKLKDRLIQALNVRQVLSYVERAEVDAGVVYRTDALESGEKVRIAAVADSSQHQPIEYPAAVVSKAKNAEGARKFLAFLKTESARQSLRSHGFALPESSSSSNGSAQPGVNNTK